MAKNKEFDLEKMGEMDDDKLLNALEAAFGDDDDLFDTEIKDNRKPTTVIKDTIVDAFSGTDNILKVTKSLIKRALPDSYGDTMDTLENVSRDVKDTYDDTVYKLEPAINNVKLGIKGALPTIEKILPAGMARKIKKFAETANEQPYSDYSKKDYQGEEISNTIQTIFGAEVAEREVRERKANIHRNIDRTINKKQFKVSATLQTHMANNIGRIVSYQDEVLDKYYRKSLDLQYRSYFALRSLLDLKKDEVVSNKIRFDNIIKNTGLPDIVKSRLNEDFKTELRNRLIGRVHDDLATRLRNLPTRTRDRLKETIRGIVEGFSGAAESSVSLNEQFSGLPLGEMAKMEGGDFARHHLGAQIGKKFRDTIPKYLNKVNPNIWGSIENFGNTLKRYHSEWPGYLNRKFGEGKGILGQIGTLTGTEFGDTNTINNSLVADATTATPWDTLSRRTLVEIIPGYLSRTLNEISGIHALLAGKETPNEVVYSHEFEDFVTKKKALKQIRKRFRGTIGSGLKDKINAIIDIVDPDGTKLSESERVELGGIIVKELRKGNNFDPRDFADPYNLDTPKAEKYAQLFRDTFNITEEMVEEDGFLTSKLQVGGAGEANLKHKNAALLYGEARGSLGNYNALLNEYFKTGNKSLLRELGILKEETGTLHVNNDYKNRDIREWLKLGNKGNYTAEAKAYYEGTDTTMGPPKPSQTFAGFQLGGLGEKIDKITHEETLSKLYKLTETNDDKKLALLESINDRLLNFGYFTPPHESSENINASHGSVTVRTSRRKNNQRTTIPVNQPTPAPATPFSIYEMMQMVKDYGGKMSLHDATGLMNKIANAGGYLNTSSTTIRNLLKRVTKSTAKEMKKADAFNATGHPAMGKTWATPVQHQFNYDFTTGTKESTSKGNDREMPKVYKIPNGKYLYLHDKLTGEWKVRDSETDEPWMDIEKPDAELVKKFVPADKEKPKSSSTKAKGGTKEENVKKLRKGLAGLFIGTGRLVRKGVRGYFKALMPAKKYINKKIDNAAIKVFKKVLDPTGMFTSMFSSISATIGEIIERRDDRIDFTLHSILDYLKQAIPGKDSEEKEAMREGGWKSIQEHRKQKMEENKKKKAEEKAESDSKWKGAPKNDTVGKVGGFMDNILSKGLDFISSLGIPELLGGVGAFLGATNIGRTVVGATEALGGLVAMATEGAIAAMATLAMPEVAMIAGTVAAVGATAYAAYKGYEALNRRRSLDRLEKIRFMQYGIPLDNGRAIGKVRFLEETIDDVYTFGSNGAAKLKLKLQEIWEKYYSDFDWRAEDERGAKAFMDWYIRRFVPVYVKHRTVASILKITLDELDSTLKDEDLSAYVKAIQFGPKDKEGKLDPYNITISPFRYYSLENRLETLSLYCQQLIIEGDKANEGKDDASKNNLDPKELSKAVTSTPGKRKENEDKKVADENLKKVNAVNESEQKEAKKEQEKSTLEKISDFVKDKFGVDVPAAANNVKNFVGRVGEDLAVGAKKLPGAIGGFVNTKIVQPVKNSLAGLISGHESGGNYDIANRGNINGHNLGISTAKVSTMTIGDILAANKKSASDPSRILAAGKYQLITPTLADAAKQLNLPMTTVFDKKTQEYIFAKYLLGIKGNTKLLNAYIKGSDVDKMKMMKNLAREWTSIADPYTGKTAGGAGNKAFVTADQALATIDKARAMYASFKEMGLSDDEAFQQAVASDGTNVPLTNLAGSAAKPDAGNGEMVQATPPKIAAPTLANGANNSVASNVIPPPAAAPNVDKSKTLEAASADNAKSTNTVAVNNSSPAPSAGPRANNYPDLTHVSKAINSTSADANKQRDAQIAEQQKTNMLLAQLTDSLTASLNDKNIPTTLMKPSESPVVKQKVNPVINLARNI